MDFEAIQNLMSQMNSSDLTMLEIEAEGVHIKMQKNNIQAENINVPVVQPQAVQTNIVENIVKPVEVVTAKEEKAQYLNANVITSPIVGTFYSATAPDKPALVKVGDKVKKGQVLCIIEAMKLMNEIESEYDGEVVEICVENEQMVEYNQPLFKIM